jgi:hypothetical protein
VAFAYCPEADNRRIITGVNFSVGIRNPFRLGGFEDVSSLLARRMADVDEPVVFMLHYTCPRVDYTDRGKSTLKSADSAQSGFRKGPLSAQSCRLGEHLPTSASGVDFSPWLTQGPGQRRVAGAPDVAIAGDLHPLGARAGFSATRSSKHGHPEHRYGGGVYRPAKRCAERKGWS